MVGLPVKPGYLWTESAGIEESVSAELWSKDTWSIDAIGTESVGGIGLVKDIGALDIGVYGVSSWERWEPEVGVGLSLSF